MIVLGIDPGSVKTGYGVVQLVDGETYYVAAGVLKVPAGWEVTRRLTTIWQHLVEVIDEYHPDEAGIEAGFVKGQQGALTSGAARGVAMVALGTRGLQPRFYAPASVKLAAAGHGHAPKEQVCRAVQATLGMKRTPEEDAGDALAVALTRARDSG